VFGPRQDLQSKYAAVIPKFIQAALRDEPLEIHGDGLQTRDFTYVSNVVEANLLATKVSNTSGEVINIACRKRYSILDLVKGIGEIVGKELKIHHVEQRTADVRHSQADISLAMRILGYEAKVDFIEGLSKTIAHFKRMSGQQ
jgi:nucleoside-diphosphate-sugar epimerase